MKKTLAGAILVLSSCLVAGCGGGGGGGNSGLSYGGQTGQAVILDNNAETIAMQAYAAGDVSASLATPLSDSASRPAAARTPNAVALVRALKSAADRAAAAGALRAAGSSRSTAGPMATVTIDNTLYDGLGGSLTMSLQADDTTGDFSGSFVFRSWHADGDTVISGTAGVSGHIALTMYEYADIHYSFSTFTMAAGGESLAVAGTVDLVANSPNASATINLVLRNDVTRKTVWLRDYTLTLFEGPDVAPADGTPDYVEVTVAGRIYLHDYGYVDITTPQPLVVAAGDLNPSSGCLVFTGSAGRSVRFTVIDAVTGFFVEADLEPDGVYEWTSADHPWA